MTDDSLAVAELSAAVMSGLADIAERFVAGQTTDEESDAEVAALLARCFPGRH